MLSMVENFFLIFLDFNFGFGLSGAFFSVLLESFAVLNAVVGVDEGFGLLLFGAFNHKLISFFYCDN